MPIPFRDADEIEELGVAGYLKLESSASASTVRGALFLINARGEPLEFTYNRLETPNTFLWRQNDVSRHSVRKLTVSLLATCSKVPRFILCLADDIYHELFCNEVLLSVPVCRIASPLKTTAHSALESQETLESPEPVHLFWFPGKPADDSIEQRLLNRLVAGGLLLEPFERILVGLGEVYDGVKQEAAGSQ